MRRLGLLGFVGTLLVVCLAGGGRSSSTSAVLTDQETIMSGAFVSAACFADDPGAPTVDASIVAKTTPYYGGFIREGSAYYVYAAVTDTGGGIDRVTADVRNLTAGQLLVIMTSGAYTVGGVSYGWRSGSLTAATPLAEGPYAYSVTAADSASQCQTAGSSVTIDHTAPYGTDVQPINNGPGGGVGRPEPGDDIVYTFSEQIEPESVLSGWTGASTNVVVRITNSGTNDILTVWDSTNTTQLPFGSVALGGEYVTADTTFGASGTASTMSQSGASITVRLGTLAGSTVKNNANATATWTPVATPTDIAGNASTTPTVNEGGAADRNF